MPPFYTYISAGNSFTGLLNTLSAVPEYAFSPYRLNGNSWTTNDVIFRLRRSSDSAEADFSYSANNVVDGDSIALNATSGAGQTLSTWSSSGADTLYIVNYYNQGSISLYMTQATTTLQPTYDYTTKKSYSNGGILELPNPSSPPTVTPVDAIERMYSGVMQFDVAAGSNGVRSYPMEFTESTYAGSIDIRYVNNYVTRHFFKYTNLTSAGGLVVQTSYFNSSNPLIVSQQLINTGSSNAVAYTNTASNTNTWSTANNSVYTISHIFNLASTQFLYDLNEVIYATWNNSTDFNLIRSSQSSRYGITI